MFSATVLISSSYRLFFLCIAVHGGELGVNRTGSADTNKKLFEQKHDRQRQAPPANATTSANATSASAKFASIKAAANATSTRDNAGQKVLLKTGQAAQAAPADECLLKAACLYGVAHRRRDDGKKNEIRASEKVEKRRMFLFYNKLLMVSVRQEYLFLYEVAEPDLVLFLPDHDLEFSTRSSVFRV